MKYQCYDVLYIHVFARYIFFIFYFLGGEGGGGNAILYSVNYLPFHLLKINRKDQHKVVFICSNIYFHVIVYT